MHVFRVENCEDSREKKTRQNSLGHAMLFTYLMIIVSYQLYYQSSRSYHNKANSSVMADINIIKLFDFINTGSISL